MEGSSEAQFTLRFAEPARGAPLRASLAFGASVTETVL